MTKPSNTDGIEAATGRSWDDWVTLLDNVGARDMEHKAIAELAHQQLEGKVDSPGWWAQGVAVAYEQHIGRREPGQQSDGSYETSVTKTLPGTKDDVFALWNEAFGAEIAFNSQRVSGKRTSITPVRNYWRCSFANGSKLTVAVENVEKKAVGKAMITISHTKLASNKEKDDWQAYWKQQIAKL